MHTDNSGIRSLVSIRLTVLRFGSAFLCYSLRAMSVATSSNEEISSYKKRKRNVLNIKDKCDIIDKLRRGQSIVNISREYNVCRSTVWGIKQSESKILSFSAQIGAAVYSRKTMKKSEDYNLDAAVYKWFKERTDEGTVLSNQMICDEALRINRQFKGEMDFKATRGWLRRFKARHDIATQNVAGKNKPTDDTQSIPDTEDSFYVVPKTPASEKSEETDLNGYPCEWNTHKTGEENNQSSFGSLVVIPEVNIKEEEPTEIIDDDDQEMTEENLPRKPTDEEAFNAIDTVIQWAELHREVNMDQLMFLRTLQTIAAKRALASISRAK